MLKKNACTIWLYDLSEKKLFLEQLAAAFRQQQIVAEKWDAKTNIETGVVVVDGSQQYDWLISLLNIQMVNKGYRILVINAHTERLSSSQVMRILNYGAEYFFERHAIEADFSNITDKILRWRNIESILHSPAIRETIAGEAPALKKLLRGVIEVVVYSDSSILITGQRGTGKELIAKIIHAIDASRNRGNFVLVDCTTINPELSGSEFFGHEKGSYTGADHTREGAFALANNGTLFLDEVGELPLSLQAALLRIIQEGAYKKVGSNTWKQTSFRLVGATNRDLEKESENGHFRKDLYDRIAAWKCQMPSLYERKQDIPLLAEHFFRKKFPDGLPVIDPSVLEYLQQRDYPGNIRELRNLVARIALRYIGKGPVTMGDIPDDERVFSPADQQRRWFEQNVLNDLITQALNEGNDIKHIMDTIKTMATGIALSMTDNNKEMSVLLGKSERWIQLHKSKIG